MIATDSHITFDKYAEYFLKVKEQAGLAESTLYGYRFRKNKLAPFIGHVQLRNLTPNVINKAYTDLSIAELQRSMYTNFTFLFITYCSLLCVRE